MLHGRCQVAPRRARSAPGARSHAPTRAHRGRRGQPGVRDPVGNQSRSKFRRRLGNRSELSEIKRLTGRLRCRRGVDAQAGGSLGTSWFPRRTGSKTPGCSLSEGQEIDLPEIPAILPPTLSPKGQTSSVRLRESSRAGVCKPLPSPTKFNAPRHPTPRSIRAPGVEKGVSGSPFLSWRGRPRLASARRSLPTLVQSGDFYS